MPELLPFTFIGTIESTGDVVNGGVLLEGFPFCPDKVDVSGYDYWTTLGGFKKGDAGSPTTTQINDSIQNAAKLYWKFYQVNATNDFDSDGTFNDFINVAGGSSRSSGLNGFDGFEEPLERAKKVGLDYGNSVSLVFPGPNTVALAFHASARNSNIKRMYNGVTTSEDNFIGYGLAIRSSIFIDSNTANQFGLGIYSASLGCSVQLGSYGDAPGLDVGEISDEAYVTFGGMPFVACAWSSGTRGGVSGTVDAAGLNASWQRTTTAYSTTLTSMEFYTEPV